MSCEGMVCVLFDGADSATAMLESGQAMVVLARGEVPVRVRITAGVEAVIPAKALSVLPVAICIINKQHVDRWMALNDNDIDKIIARARGVQDALSARVDGGRLQ